MADHALLTALAVLALVLLAWHLTYTAARLDRLHTRVEGALAALDGQLVRRADQALDAGRTLDDPTLAAAARACLAAGPFAGDTLTQAGVLGPAPDRVDREDALTAALDRAALVDLPDDARARLADVAWRVEVAHHVHADAVDDALRVRRRPLVRVFRLAGRAAQPALVPLAGIGRPAR